MTAFVLIDVIHILLGGLLGLIGGSLTGHFGWRAADRLPGETRWPQCVYCQVPSKITHLVPIFGWLIRKGFYRLPCPCHARTKIWALPVIEITGFVLGCAVIMLSSWSIAIIPVCLVMGVLPALALIDLHFGIIPDELNITLGVLGLSWIALSYEEIWLHFISSAVLLGIGLFFALVYSRIRKREMLGLGDVKFFAAAGFWLDPHIVPWFLAAAGILGTCFNLVWQKRGGGEEAPFAPALCLALLGSIFYELASFLMLS